MPSACRWMMRRLPALILGLGCSSASLRCSASCRACSKRRCLSFSQSNCALTPLRGTKSFDLRLITGPACTSACLASASSWRVCWRRLERCSLQLDMRSCSGAAPCFLAARALDLGLIDGVDWSAASSSARRSRRSAARRSSRAAARAMCDSYTVDPGVRARDDERSSVCADAGRPGVAAAVGVAQLLPDRGRGAMQLALLCTEPAASTPH